MAGMLISGMPPRAYIHAHTLSFSNTAVHQRGGDVILSAAAPAEEASEEGERERERDGRGKGIERGRKATGKEKLR